MNLTQYESTQISEIREWKSEEPSVVSESVGIILSPITWLINTMIPEAAMCAALDLSSSAAEWLTDTTDIVRNAGVSSVEELRHHDLEQSDGLANTVHNWAIGLAAGEGGTTGVVGLPGLAADVTVLIVMAIRTIHKIGVCYGYETTTQCEKDFVLAILAVTVANDGEEKIAALNSLRSVSLAVTQQAGNQSTDESDAPSRMNKEAGIISSKNLAKKLGVNLTKRKALQSIPAVGALVGASVNGWYIKEVGWVARRAFQERWLIENHKVVEI